MEVLGLNGHLEYQADLYNISDGSVHLIDLEKLPDGLFIVRIITKDFIHFEKIVKH